MNDMPNTVKVKPLVWQKKVAETAFGEYVIYTRFGKIEKFNATFNKRLIGDDFDSVDEAKEVAQADYKRRILSAIETPDPWQPIETAPDDGSSFLGGWQFVPGDWVFSTIAFDPDDGFICPVTVVAAPDTKEG